MPLKRPKEVVPGLGEHLRRAREIKDLSLRELGKRTGMSAARICQLEAGDGNAKLVNFVRLAKALDVSASELLDPEIDERSKFLQLARRMRTSIGLAEMEFLADLNLPEAKVALQFMHAGVEQYRRPPEARQQGNIRKLS